MSRRRMVFRIGIAAVASAVALLVFILVHSRARWSIIQGAVIRRDADTRNQTPIGGVLITASRGNRTLTAESDATGYFKIAFRGPILPGQTVNLTFRHPDYEPLYLSVLIPFRSSVRQLVIATMMPVAVPVRASPAQPATVVSNLRVRFTVNSSRAENIGSAVKIFQVVNRGNTPCRHQAPCSPDGYWKASTDSINLDAGVGNEFRDARVSCIAGPCPFTRIDPSGFADGGRSIVASAEDWSDTATFLLQAEVFHDEIVSNVRESYPVIFGRTFNFTLPPTAEGTSLEAELNGVEILFPLGPNLDLSWATCDARTGPGTEKAAVYQCELKPGFRF